MVLPPALSSEEDDMDLDGDLGQEAGADSAGLGEGQEVLEGPTSHGCSSTASTPPVRQAAQSAAGHMTAGVGVASSCHAVVIRARCKRKFQLLLESWMGKWSRRKWRSWLRTVKWMGGGSNVGPADLIPRFGTFCASMQLGD